MPGLEGGEQVSSLPMESSESLLILNLKCCVWLKLSSLPISSSSSFFPSSLINLLALLHCSTSLHPGGLPTVCTLTL